MPRMIAPRTGAPEQTLAEEQEDYAPLTVAIYGDNGDLGPRTLLSRWRLTDEERAAIAAGEDLYIGLVTFGQPMQPISVQVGEGGWDVPSGGAA
jgi:hypothetical protein